MPFIDRSSRVGRSQGASIFWGIVSVFFAAGACFYYQKNHDNERHANQWREEAMQLRDENEALNSQKDHLQASKSEAEAQLKTREDLIAQKETQLAAEETRIESLGQQTQSITQQNPSQVAMVKKFNDAIHKLGKDGTWDVVERSGRPVLRVPNTALFGPGDATLKPEGKALLNQLTLAITGQIDNFELRVVSYTDTAVEADAADPSKKDADSKPAADAKPHYTTSWDLTAARAATLGHYYRDQTTLPFLNVLVTGRGDSEPISSNTGENHAHNRRVEITVTPMPVAFHPPEPDKTKAKDADTDKPAADTAAKKDSSPQSKDAPPPAKKDKSDKLDKPKEAAKDSAKDATKDAAKASTSSSAKKDTTTTTKSDKGSGH